jgi:ornithine carbamoyltransferase
MKKNILSIQDIGDEIEKIINLGIKIKKEIKEGKKFNYLKGKTLAMIFERESTRTRVSFEMGTTLLGGHSIFLNKDDIIRDKRVSIENLAKVVSRYVDLILYRSLKYEDLCELAKHSTVPVINGLGRYEHPCQILADFMTIKEHKGRLNNLNFVFIGDGEDNLTHSYLLGCPNVGMNITVISPRIYWPSDYYINKAKEIADNKNSRITITSDINAVKSADIIATDTWISFWEEKERKQRVLDFKNYTVTQKIMNQAKKDAIFMHCMPIHYGEEVVKNVIHGSKSVIFDEAENRMWVQMGLMMKLLS